MRKKKSFCLTYNIIYPKLIIHKRVLKATNINSSLQVYLRLNIIIIILIITISCAFAQTGPGGVGNSGNLPVWLRASDIGVGDGNEVTTWSDQSGNGNDFTSIAGSGGLRPTYRASSINGSPGVLFGGDASRFEDADGEVYINNQTGYTLLTLIQSDELATVDVGIFDSEDPDGADDGFTWRYDNAGAFGGGDNVIKFGVEAGGQNQYESANNTHTVEPQLMLGLWQQGEFNELWLDGTQDVPTNQGDIRSGLVTGASKAVLGRGPKDNGSSGWNGFILEFALWQYKVNNAERILIENYLAAKYRLSIANDFYVFDNTHGVDVIGIGGSGVDSHEASFSDGILGIGTPSSLADGDWLLTGHDGGDASTWSTDELMNGDTNLERLAREWRFDVTNDPGTVTLTLNPNDLPAFNPDFDFYTLWVDSDGDFTSGATQYPLTQNGGNFEATGITVTDGMFLTIAAYRPEINFTQTAFSGIETTSPATFEINIDYAVDANITVDYTVSGTCTEDLPSAGTFTISAGSTTTILSQAITSGDGFEPDETIILTLTGGTQSGGILGASAISTYTVNDDGASATNTIQFDAPFSYSHKKTITIDNSMVSGASDLVDFPILITIDGADFIEMNANVQDANGYDIRFTYQNAVTWLAHDIESYDIGNGVYTAWVSVPLLSNSDNTVIEMYYGNSSVSTDPSSSSVWDEYHGVYTLGNNDFTDASSNGYNGTNNGTTDEVGIAGRSQLFDGSSDIDISPSFPNLTTAFTISAWVFVPNITLGGSIFSDDANNTGGYGLTLGEPGNGLLRSYSRNLPGGGVINGTSALNASTWHQVVMVVDRANQDRVIYLDGASQVSDLSDIGTWGTDAGQAAIGGEGPGGANSDFDGRIDHVTISSVVRSAGWISTEYNMISAPATYFTIGSETVLSAFEVSESTDNLSLTIALTSVDANDVDIDYAVTSGTATNGSDFTLAAGTLTITAGNLSGLITVDIADDSKDEVDETFTVSLTNPSSVSDVSLGANNAIEITLIDNDSGPVIALSDTILYANEGSSINEWSVDLSASSGQAITVDYTVSSISATAGVDYILESGTLTIAPNSISAGVGFNIIDDENIESSESFAIKLSNPVNGSLNADFDSLTVTINDNDNFGIDGPGGVGDADGSGTLVMWMIADSANVSGSAITSWENEVGISELDLTPPLTAPTLVTNARNGHAEISFANVNDVLSTSERLSASYFPYNEASTFVVTRHDNLVQRSNTYGTSTVQGGGLATNRFSAHNPWNGQVYFDIGNCCGTDGRSQFVYDPDWTGNYTLFSYTASATEGKTVRGNATQKDFDAGTDIFLNHTDYFFNLGMTQTNNFQGDILEYIMYTSPLNSAQVIITENYLAAKYNLTLDQNDYYAFKTTHSNEVVGIGQEDAANFHNAAKSSLLTISNASDLDDGDYVMVGHDNLGTTSWTTTDVPSQLDNIQRIAREFRVDVTGTPGTISIAIDDSRLPALPAGYSDYVLLIDDDGLFANGAKIYAMTPVGGEFVVNNVAVTQGSYFTIATHRRTIEFTGNSSQDFENTNRTIALSLSVASGSDISIGYTVTGSATPSADFSLPTSGSFVIKAGRTAEVIDLGIIDESVIESDESIIVTLGAAPLGTIAGANSVFTYTINDDDNERDIEFRNFCDYGFSKTIKIAHELVDDTDGADLANFPLLISFTDADLASVANGGNVENSNGYDIAFTYKDSLIWLDHEIENYNATTGAYNSWVKIPLLDFDDSTELVMYYGNSNIDSDPSVKSVWSEYLGVWHLNGGVEDSSPNNYGGTDNGTTDVTGKVGNGRNFDGIGDFIELASFPDLQSDFSISAWVNTDNIAAGQRVFIDDDNNTNGYALSIGDPGSGRLRFYSRGANPTSVDGSGAFGLTAGNWFYIAGVADIDAGGSRTLYVNENVAASTTHANMFGTDVGSAAIGGETLSGETGNRFTGTMDEVRVYNGLLSPSRVFTEYNNYDAPGSFYVIGPEVASGGCVIAENSPNDLELTVYVNPVDNVSNTEITYTSTGGTATNTSDYTLVQGTVTVPAGSQSATFKFPLINDLIDESDETIQISLSNPSSNTKIGSVNQQIFTITDDDDGPTIGFLDTLSVANEGSSLVSITLELGLQSGNDVSVDYTVTGGNATTGSDFIALSGTAVISAGDLTTTISFQPIDDAIIESPETVELTISNPTNGTLKTDFDIHTITIADNDDLGFEGPGGVGDVENALGENLLKLWLIADSVTSSGGNVTRWDNIVKNVSVDYDMVPAGTAPKVVNAAVNGRKEISFNNVSDALVSEGTLSAASFPGNEMSVFIVTETDNLNQDSYAYATDNSENGAVDANSISASIPNGAGNIEFDIAGDNYTAPYLTGWAGKHSIYTHIVSVDTFLVYRNNNMLVNRNDANPSFTGHTAYNFYLGKNGAGEFFQGDIAEFIMFSRDVNIAQSNIINNYLGAKYNLNIVNDYYNFEVSHGVEVAGIGRYDANNLHVAARAGIVTISNADDLDDGEYVLFGHDNGAISSWSASEVPSAGILRTAREWRFDNTGTPGTISIAINSDLLPALPNGNEDYVIMQDADGDFSSGATVINTVLVDGQYKASDLTIASGDYVTFGIATRTISFSPISRSGSETVAANATILLSLESSSIITLDYAVTGGTATGSSTDYSLASSGQITFNAGQTSINLGLGIINDSELESDETIEIKLSNPSTGVSLGDSVFTYTINDDDNSRNVQFNASTSTGAESVSAISLQVDLNSVDAMNDTEVNYSITGGTAEASPSPDYSFTAGTLVIPATESTGTIDFTILDDVLSESTETIIVSLSSPVNANLGTNVTHTYSITDNDGIVTVEFQNATTTIDEGGSIAKLVVELSSTSGQDVQVNYSATEVSALGGGTDYSLADGTLTIPAGQQLGTINVALTDDGIEESAETFTVTLSGEVGATLGSEDTHTVTISDNDAEFGYYGPGGVGDFESNMLWLDATAVNGKGVPNLSDGANVSTWVDRSGNGSDFTAIGSQPTFDADALNLKNTVIISSSNQGFQAPAGFDNALSNYSFISVLAQSSGEYLVETNTTATSDFRLSQGANGLYSINDIDYLPSQSTNIDITTWIFNSENSPTSAAVSRNGVALLSDDNFEVMALNENFALGSRNADQTQATTDFAGNISEFIVYRNVINEAQKVIIENYLANKYDLVIADDYYSYEGTYGKDIVGIGQVSGEKHLQSMSDSLMMISGASDLQDGEFVFVGHDNGSDLTWTTAESPSGDVNVRRLAREWRTDITGTPGTIIIKVDTTQLPNPPNGFDQYVVYTDEDGDFRSGATAYQLEYSSVFGFHVTEEVTITDGTFITLGIGKPVIQFFLAANGGDESVTNPSIGVGLNFTLSEAATVNFAATGGTATGSNIDYLLPSGRLTLSAGQTTANISLGVINDLIEEADETIEITLTTPSSNVSLGGTTVFTYTIHDNDNSENRTVEFATAGPGAGDEATPTVTSVTVTINTPDDDVATTVDLLVVSGGASAADETDDFVLSSSTITFPADNSTVSQAFDITIVDDAIFEGTEQITIQLTNPVNADLGTITEYTLDITDNEALPVAGFSDGSSFVSEASGTASIQLALDAVSVNDVTINYTVASTATSGTDYTLSDGSVLILAGSMNVNIQALIVNDLITESAETVTVTLTGGTNGAVGGITSHVLTILDDDQTGSTGPGGVGDASNNLVWLRGDNFVAGTWSDISGNSNDFTGAGPVVGATGINSQGTVAFDGTQSMSFASAINTSPSDFDIFFVTDTDILTDQVLFDNTDGILFGQEHGSGGFQDVDGIWKGDEIATGSGAPSIIQYNLESGSGLAAISLNGTEDTPTVPFDYTATSLGVSSTLGSLSGGGSGFDGEIGEMLVFNNSLNNAQRIIVNNYLSARYDITIANDYFAYDDGTASNDYFFNLIGIGREDADNIHVTATAEGFLTISNPNDLADGEYLMVANDGADRASWTFTGAPANMSTRRIAREWRVDRTGDLGTITLQVDSTSLPTPPSGGLTWALIVTSDGDFTNIDAVYPLTSVSGDIIGIDGLDLNDGDFFTFALVEYVSTGISSDFSDPMAWSTGVVPTAGTNVKIIDGHSLFLTEDVVIGAMTLEGTGALDLAGFTLEFSEDCIILNGTGIVNVSTAGSTIGYANPNVTEQCVTGMIYNNLYTEGPSGSTKYLLGDITVEGDFNLQSGGGAGAVFDSRALGTMDDYDMIIQGDWISEISFLPRSGDVTFNGVSAQMINTAGGETYNNLIINKVGTTTMADSTLTLASDISTDGILTLTSGFVDMGSFDITVNSASSIVGGSEQAYIIADDIGVLRHAITALSTAYGFPIGDDNEYAPFTFTLNSGTLSSSNVTINLRDAKHTDIEESTFITRYWSLNNENITGVLDYSVSYVYDDTDVVGSEGGLLARKFSVAGDDIGGSVNISMNTLSNSGYDSFSDFTGESAPTPLPITLLSFKGKPTDRGVLLEWIVLVEKDNSHFEVLQSLGGEFFSVIGKVLGAGNSDTQTEYEFLDLNAVFGLNYYALKQVDFDGTETIVSLIVVDNNYSGFGMTATAYPNPTEAENLNVSIRSDDTHTPVRVKIVNLNGQVFYNDVILDLRSFNGRIIPDVNMVEGVYILIVKQGNTVSQQKIIIK